MTGPAECLPQVLVAVGTDHHPFDRLVQWVDRWLDAGGADRAKVVVQYGRSGRPERAEGHSLLPHEQLQKAMEEASVVICHGGPATIVEARRHGHLPICVPRDPTLGEHVDSHQQLFARRMGSAGVVELAETEATFRAALDRALAEPETFRVHTAESQERLPATKAVGDLIASLMGARPTSHPEPDRVRLLYVAGLGRSGSTLVERLAGQLPGAVGIGETAHLWQRGLVDGELCGCGQPFAACPFWSGVGVQAFGGWDQIDPHEVMALKASVDRTRHSPALLGHPSKAFSERLGRYNDLLTQLYRAAADLSGADLVVDASKHGSLLHVLRHNPAIDLRVLHVVRDSPAVAYSWTKTVRRPESTGSLDYMQTWSPARTARQWLSENALVEAAAARGVPTLRLRYEDFVAAPAASLRDIQRLVELPVLAGDLDFIHGDSVELRPAHTVAGNPMRFTSGTVALRADTAWEDKLPRRDRMLVEALTAPMRWRYGYLEKRA